VEIILGKSYPLAGKHPEGAILRRCPDISKLKKLEFTPKINFKKV